MNFHLHYLKYAPNKGQENLSLGDQKFLNLLSVSRIWSRATLLGGAVPGDMFGAMTLVAEILFFMTL